MQSPLRLQSASRDHRPRLQHRSNSVEEKDPSYRRRRLQCEAADFAHRKTKVQIRASLDAARDGNGDETIGERLEIRCDLDGIPSARARRTHRERAETSGQGMG